MFALLQASINVGFDSGKDEGKWTHQDSELKLQLLCLFVLLVGERFWPISNLYIGVQYFSQEAAQLFSATGGGTWLRVCTYVGARSLSSLGTRSSTILSPKPKSHDIELSASQKQR